MIGVKELRVFNYIQYKFHKDSGGWEDIKVLPKDIDFISKNPNNDIYKPIPLTDSWLKDFGFDSNPYEDRYELEGFYIQVDKTKGFLDLWVTNCRLDLKHVHQLQNLYYALTGKELEKK